MAGKRAGIEGERSGLFIEQVRVIKEMRRTFGKPRYMVWENVPGVFSSGKGEDFRIVLEETGRIVEEGLVIPRPPKGKWGTAGAILGDGWSIAWRVLDAQFWGVPQRRRRIFLVADFGGQTAPEILFKPESVSGDIEEGRAQREGTAGGVESGAGEAKPSTIGDVHWHDPLLFDPRSPDGVPGIYYDGVTPTLNTAQGGQRQTCVIHSMQRSDEYKESEVSSTLAQRQYKSATDLITQCPNGAGFMGTSYGGYESGVGTLRSNGGDVGGGSETLAISSQRVRRLTPLECERLQGFPDHWTGIERASDTQRYKALGNSMAIPCVRFVMDGIAQAIRGGLKVEPSIALQDPTLF